MNWAWERNRVDTDHSGRLLHVFSKATLPRKIFYQVMKQKEHLINSSWWIGYLSIALHVAHGTYEARSPFL